ncbi:MAG: Mut7-C RNAse domain-containing protein [Anaerolineae bacterium]
MRFLADSMLGQLAKWLRLLGYDTLYLPHFEDGELVRRARAEDRVVLTRDRHLSRRGGLESLLVRSDDPAEQLTEVVERLELSAEQQSPRCPACNHTLEQVGKPSIRDRVPPYVFAKHTRFRRCPECGRVYWRGTHWNRIQGRLERLRTQAAR